MIHLKYFVTQHRYVNFGNKVTTCIPVLKNVVARKNVSFSVKVGGFYNNILCKKLPNALNTKLITYQWLKLMLLIEKLLAVKKKNKKCSSRTAEPQQVDAFL